jgi:tetratricopeptide (TPR) repeat protein
MGRALALVFGRRWAEGLKQDSATKKLDATVLYADAWDAVSLRELGHLPESVAAYQVYQNMTGPAAGLAATYGRMGKREEALKIIHTLEERRKKQWVDPVFIAYGYIEVGDHERALSWLETAFKEKGFALRYVDPYWLDGLRNNPRLKDLQARVMATTFKD